MRYVDPVDLTPNLDALSEEPKDEIWRTRLVKSVDNRLLSWETPVGRRGQGPLLGIENIESEMRDLLKPLMGSLPTECPPEAQEDLQPKH